ncbi:MAG: hypothetical protein IK031_01355 [Bacteroidales bacterium]|nr:hypothetical protein [Bacteroidales bacterium]
MEEKKFYQIPLVRTVYVKPGCIVCGSNGPTSTPVMRHGYGNAYELDEE